MAPIEGTPAMKNLLNVFTPDRREAVATMLLETWKLTLLLALASNLFRKYNSLVSLVVAGLFIIGLVAVALLFPPKLTERRE